MCASPRCDPNGNVIEVSRINSSKGCSGSHRLLPERRILFNIGSAHEMQPSVSVHNVQRGSNAVHRAHVSFKLVVGLKNGFDFT